MGVSRVVSDTLPLSVLICSFLLHASRLLDGRHTLITEDSMIDLKICKILSYKIMHFLVLSLQVYPNQLYQIFC